ncbi:MAG: transposase [Oscillospiraceae bacterium]|nr:transposase [Oscillospiraceae bacterium]
MFTTYEGGTTGKRFVTYLRETLLPTLEEGDIVVMDNLRSHHVKEVEELLCQNEITLLYLPPYSPDLNPIEKMWSKMKSYLRRWKIRVKEALPAAVALHPCHGKRFFSATRNRVLSHGTEARSSRVLRVHVSCRI